jgi:hypothetical protein
LTENIFNSNKLWLSLRRVCIGFQNDIKQEKNYLIKQEIAEFGLNFLHGVYNDFLSEKEYYDTQMLDLLEDNQLNDEEKKAFREASWYFDMRDFYDTFVEYVPNYIYVPKREIENE